MNKPTGVVNIHGREYETVALRVKRFREAHPDWTLETLITHRDVDCVVMEARISDEQGRLRANGHAEEYRKASSINRTSALENCETSAIGRALAALGLGGTEFASADEVARAVSGQKASVDDVVPEERRSVLRDVADAILVRHGAGDEWGCYEEAASIDDPEEKMLLWSYLKPHPAVRSAIKRMADQEREMDKKASEVAA